MIKMHLRILEGEKERKLQDFGQRSSVLGINIIRDAKELPSNERKAKMSLI